MDSAFAFGADGLGSIPADSKSKTKVEYSDGLSPSRYKVVGEKMEPGTNCPMQYLHVI